MDRSNSGWRNHVKTTHYKLQLHTSGAFVITPSLGAAMYLLAMRLYKREYALAARLIPSVLSDVPFVGEEGWLKSLLAGIADDPHPDAIAMRLRITLQCAECSELPPFGGYTGRERSSLSAQALDKLRRLRLDFMREEFDTYVYKWGAVSVACRLTQKQELQLVKMLNHQKRGKFLERLKRCQAKPRHGHHLTHYHVALMPAKVGGKILQDHKLSIGPNSSLLWQSLIHI